MTTTDPTALLAEAAAKVWIEDVPMGVPESIAQAILAASPALARAIAVGAAWLAAEEALPEGWWLGGCQRYGGQWSAAAWAPVLTQQPDHIAAHSDTPEAALLDLAAALRKERGA